MYINLFMPRNVIFYPSTCGDVDVAPGEIVLVQNPHVLGQYSFMLAWNTEIVHKLEKDEQLEGKFGIRDLSEHGSKILKNYMKLWIP
jgi:hypothetical protein